MDVPATPSLASVLRGVVAHRGVQTAVVLWIVGYALVLWLAHGLLPFDRPAIAQLPFAVQVAAPTIGMIQIFVLMFVALLVTRKRVIPDMAARAPAHRIALRETSFVLAYAALGQIGGWVVGPALGYRPFSFHIAGTVFGCSVAPGTTEVWIWAFYNFLVFAVAPYLYFRGRYSGTDLNLRSSNSRNDTLLIFVVLAIESAFELSVFDQSIIRLNAHQIFLGAPLTFAVFFIGVLRAYPVEIRQFELFVDDEASAIEWIRQLLSKKPQKTSDLQPQFMRETNGWAKHETLLELETLLRTNFIQYDGRGPVPSQIHSYLSTNYREYRSLERDSKELGMAAMGRWYVADPDRQIDLERLRDKELLSEFELYKTVPERKLKLFRTEAVRAGFKASYEARDYKTIIGVAAKLPENVLQEDEKLLMYYDVARMRLDDE